MTIKRWLITLMVLLVVADIAILLDVFVLRQILGFLCFTTIPGLLILYTLKLNRISFLKKFLLSVGLSLSFLIFGGLLINTLLPWFGYSKPLSTPPLVLCLSLAIAILGFSAYWRNRDDIQFTFIHELGRDIKNKPLWPLLFPLLFPLLAVIGRKVMDTTGGSNVIIMVMYLLIPLYIILVMWQNKKIPQATYPIAIGMISVSLLLARGLMSNYLIGDDIYAEYHAFRLTSQNLHWSMAAWPTNVAASLSVSLLPAIFQSILGINPLYIFKVVSLPLISLTPIIGYVIYEKYLGPLYGFLSSFFFMAQLPFICQMSGHIRLGIALIAFALAVMVLFDDHIAGLNKRILFLIFLFSVVVEYYVLPVLFLFILSVFLLTHKISKGSLGTQNQNLSIITATLLPFILIFFWWGQITVTAFNDYIFLGQNVLSNLSNMFVAEIKGGDTTLLYTHNPFLSLPLQVPGIVQRITFAVVSIGVMYTLIRKELRVKFSGYAILMVPCFTLLVAMIILPLVSLRYSSTRLYIQVLVILAPAFIVGCKAITDSINAVWTYFARHVRFIVRNYRPQYMPTRFNLLAILIMVIVVSQFFSASALYYQLLGFPGNEVMDKNSMRYGVFYVYDSEVIAAEWLGRNNVKNLRVYLGNMEYPNGRSVFVYTDQVVGGTFEVTYFRKQDPEPNSYVFLRHLNVVVGQVTSPDLEYVRTAEGMWIAPPLTVSAHYFAAKNKIYASGSAEIYR